ncbi:hypothetical protein PIB30_049704 [Stylosanthes scabra]|uniref:AAA+ ATPase domain-containing protein n=1 Tax=Stylosanthes scabra TaxID=79078 RepID=A0ABU6ZG51_9FABA|nr:hypothetical protein [Stylosanthes scabra]
MFPTKELPAAASSFFSAYASVAATTMLVRSTLNQFIPQPVRSYLHSLLRRYLFAPPSSTTLSLIIDHYYTSGFAPNQLFEAAEIYLSTKIGSSTNRLRISKTPRQKNLTVTIDNGQVISDKFDDVMLTWRVGDIVDPIGTQKQQQQKRHLELTFKKEFKDKVLDSYLPHVLERAAQIKNQERVLKLYSHHCPFNYDDKQEGGRGFWGSVKLEHPSTFETLAMDPAMKKAIVEDLDRFVRRKEFYRRVGKAWKRGYLLYGPPGTGKSTLVAAMANYLKFDIYDLELSSVNSNQDLRRALLSTSNRSILVIEDIDCSAESMDRRSTQDNHLQNFDYIGKPSRKLSLSGLLNCIDGLWSSFGDERIIVLTTNHKEKLDPALLRPGRMDVHINMSYCSPQAFKLLASNYLGLPHTCPHPFYREVHGLLDTTEATPAEVAEELMKTDDPTLALQGLASFLKRKRLPQLEENQIKEDQQCHQKKFKSS